jgi:hypothetical protein
MMLKWKKRRSVGVCSSCRTVITINDYPVTDGEGAAGHGLCNSCMSRLVHRLAPPASLSRPRVGAR